MVVRTLFVAIVTVLFLTGPAFAEEKGISIKESDVDWDQITPEELRKKVQKAREERGWQKVKPTGEEWKRWQKGLNQMGRFQGIPTGAAAAYVIDTKLGHVWFLHSDRHIKYMGCVFPLKEIGKKILDLP